MKSNNHKGTSSKHRFPIKTVMILLQTKVTAFQHQTPTHCKAIGCPKLFVNIQNPVLRKPIHIQQSNPSFHEKFGIHMNTNMKTNLIDPISLPSPNIVQTSLIGPFSILMERPEDFQFNNDGYLFETCKLYPIPTSVDDKKKDKQYKYGIGELALKALQSMQNPANQDTSINDDTIFQIYCRINYLKDSNETISIHIQKSDYKKIIEETTADDEQFVEVISKLMIQRAMMEQYQKYMKSLQSSTDKETKQIHFEIHFGTTLLHHTMMIEHSLLSDSYMQMSAKIQNIQEKLCMKLFDLEDKNNSNELVDMVDSNKNRIAIVPRSIVHTCNILHRGIGMIVCQNAHIDPIIENNNENMKISATTHNQPMIYVHRRTDTKRIFPSLYDMFIGGVSLSGEESIVTAAREVAEELGLTQALTVIENNNHASDDLNSDGSILRGPLFDCTICTAYNRCIVTMFTYRVDEQKETFKVRYNKYLRKGGYRSQSLSMISQEAKQYSLSFASMSVCVCVYFVCVCTFLCSNQTRKSGKKKKLHGGVMYLMKSLNKLDICLLKD